ncbi:hypothetical protein EIN_368300 [Entamoeba invadens IP1]|uniref:RING-type domain-containing protein n=1 Tax=Entamoeba invadens IP1 TaxID=370355 RepID=A0A0A1U744_ENTIV|nr:hypothetical protein EIN_368300 [Entamoeba invadens IP1]ELP88822.1 hypothetical protein EIN_368300 [Entamoeba invadens IP1]|eukprot:XP_004255593.1 hypothetical protein EIN_368300 [Entamoeba invadens IP1]
MFGLFHRKEHIKDPHKQQVDALRKQLDVKKYSLPSHTELRVDIKKGRIEKLIRTKQIAPIYPTEDPYCEDDKVCMICFETVRQGMNCLNCCSGKRYICSNCLVTHPKFNANEVTLFCDVCQKHTTLSISVVDIEKEADKMLHRPTTNNDIAALVKSSNENYQEKKKKKLIGVNKDVIEKFKLFGIELRDDIPPEKYNAIDLNLITDQEMATTLLMSIE